jgi:hypothetical protein
VRESRNTDSRDAKTTEAGVSVEIELVDEDDDEGHGRISDGQDGQKVYARDGVDLVDADDDDALLDDYDDDDAGEKDPRATVDRSAPRSIQLLTAVCCLPLSALGF